MKKYFKKFFPFFLCCIIAVLIIVLYNPGKEKSTPSVQQPDYCYDRYFESIIVECNGEISEDKGSAVSTYAASSVAVDYRDGHILYGDDYTKQLPMASTTKILTAIIALENAQADEIVTISSKAAGSPKVHLGVREGEQYYLEDLLYSMMLESHNDSAVAIAEHIGGSTEGFAEIMNAKAKEIGIRNSSFVTPNGLDDENHYSTAYDMALIGSYAIRNEKFLALVNTSSHSFSEINGKAYHTVSNINSYLTLDNTAIGIKTGFTGKAGYCFVGANKYEDTIVVSCVLASGWYPNRTYKWHDMREIMSYVRESYISVKQTVDESILSFPTDKGRKNEIRILPYKLELLSDGSETVTRVIKVTPENYNSNPAEINDMKNLSATASDATENSYIEFYDEKDKNNEKLVIDGYTVEEYYYYGNVKRLISNGVVTTIQAK